MTSEELYEDIANSLGKLVDDIKTNSGELDNFLEESEEIRKKLKIFDEKVNK